MGAFRFAESIGPTIATTPTTGQVVTRFIIPNCFSKPSGNGILRAIQVLEPNRQTVAYDLLFFASSQDVAAVNGTVFDIPAAVLTAQRYLGHVSIVSGDIALINNYALVNKLGLYFPVFGDPIPDASMGFTANVPNVTSARDGKSLYCVMISRGSPTYTTAPTLRLGIEQAAS